MIQELKIKNFLSFKDEVVFSFEATSDKTLENYYVAEQPDGTRLLKLAMVYGANASGKSNLIAAFQFLNDFTSNIPEEKGMDTQFVPFMFDKTILKPGVLELIFYPNGKKYKYQLIINPSEVLEEKLFFYPGTQPAVVFERTFNEKSKTSIIEFGAKINISNQAKEAIQLKTLKNTSVLAAYNQVNLSIAEIDTVNEWFEDQYLNSIDPYMDLTGYSDDAIQKSNDVKEHVLEFLKEADFNITDVKFEDKIRKLPDFLLKNIDSSPFSDEQKEQIKKEKAIHIEETVFTHKVLMDGEEKYFSLPERRQSKGTLRYYGLSAPFYHTIQRNAFLPIDEIGSALHPLLVIHFISEFLKKSERAQLLFTTHNMSLLNEKDILRKDAIWFTEKKEDGATDLFSMSDFNFRKELSFFNAYKIGKFGAIPEL
ncbi:AAA family ATPase [Plebeiibacterium marinum]|uniref:ATP-binding protein n=1 Tax=Plebeiibacterium marinum TaxID=2992111 RepID=A0AAE3SKP1_9BACT|nr:ATP-binding protein [Plebeiobacterium marinum]MCW3807065.1 ATP-binding protein [Plebeiobacterium marinum]